MNEKYILSQPIGGACNQTETITYGNTILKKTATATYILRPKRATLGLIEADVAL